MKTSFYSIWLAAAVLVTTSFAEEPEPEKEKLPGPPDWQCTYPIKQETCREIVKWWSDHNGIPMIDDQFVTATCKTCTPDYVKTSNQKNEIVGYLCKVREGRHIIATDLDAPIVVYGEATSPHGWRIDRWYLHKCARHWVCHERCSLTSDDPKCIAASIISFGRFLPITGDACTMEFDPTETGAPEQDDPAPTSGGNTGQPRDNTWEPGN